MAARANGFSKKFVVQIEADLKLDELARVFVSGDIPRKRKTFVSEKFTCQPTKIQNRRQTVSSDLPTDKALNEPVLELSLSENAGNPEPVVTARRTNRAKSVTFGDVNTVFYDRNDYVVRMDRILPLANVSRIDVSSSAHFLKNNRSSFSGGVCESAGTDPIQQKTNDTMAEHIIISSPTTSEEIHSSIDNRPEKDCLMTNTNSIITCSPSPLIDFCENDVLLNVQTTQPTDIETGLGKQVIISSPMTSAEIHSSIDNGAEKDCLMTNTNSIITCSPSPLIDFCENDVVLNVQTTQPTAIETGLSEVDILTGMDNENLMNLQPCLTPIRKTTKPVPNLLPLKVVQAPNISCRRQSLTAQFLIAAIHEIDSMGHHNPWQTVEKELCTTALDFSDGDFGILHYSDSE